MSRNLDRLLGKTFLGDGLDRLMKSASMRCDRCGHKTEHHEEDDYHPGQGRCNGIMAEGGKGLCRCQLSPSAFMQKADYDPIMTRNFQEEDLDIPTGDGTGVTVESGEAAEDDDLYGEVDDWPKDEGTEMDEGEVGKAPPIFDVEPDESPTAMCAHLNCGWTHEGSSREDAQRAIIEHYETRHVTGRPMGKALGKMLGEKELGDDLDVLVKSAPAAANQECCPGCNAPFYLKETMKEHARLYQAPDGTWHCTTTGQPYEETLQKAHDFLTGKDVKCPKCGSGKWDSGTDFKTRDYSCNNKRCGHNWSVKLGSWSMKPNVKKAMPDPAKYGPMKDGRPHGSVEVDLPVGYPMNPTVPGTHAEYNDSLATKKPKDPKRLMFPAGVNRLEEPEFGLTAYIEDPKKDGTAQDFEGYFRRGEDESLLKGTGEGWDEPHPSDCTCRACEGHADKGMLGAGAGAGIGAAMGGPAGALLGGALGEVVAAEEGEVGKAPPVGVDESKDRAWGKCKWPGCDWKTDDWNHTGDAAEVLVGHYEREHLQKGLLGAGAGAGIGAMMGGPAGALIGGGLGSVVAADEDKKPEDDEQIHLEPPLEDDYCDACDMPASECGCGETDKARHRVKQGHYPNIMNKAGPQGRSMLGAAGGALAGGLAFGPLGAVVGGLAGHRLQHGPGSLVGKPAGEALAAPSDAKKQGLVAGIREGKREVTHEAGREIGRHMGRRAAQTAREITGAPGSARNPISFNPPEEWQPVPEEKKRKVPGMPKRKSQPMQVAVVPVKQGDQVHLRLHEVTNSELSPPEGEQEKGLLGIGGGALVGGALGGIPGALIGGFLGDKVAADEDKHVFVDQYHGTEMPKDNQPVLQVFDENSDAHYYSIKEGPAIEDGTHKGLMGAMSGSILGLLLGGGLGALAGGYLGHKLEQQHDLAQQAVKMDDNVQKVEDRRGKVEQLVGPILEKPATEFQPPSDSTQAGEQEKFLPALAAAGRVVLPAAAEGAAMTAGSNVANRVLPEEKRKSMQPHEGHDQKMQVYLQKGATPERAHLAVLLKEDRFLRAYNPHCELCRSFVSKRQDAERVISVMAKAIDTGVVRIGLLAPRDFAWFRQEMPEMQRVMRTS